MPKGSNNLNFEEKRRKKASSANGNGYSCLKLRAHMLRVFAYLTKSQRTALPFAAGEFYVILSIPAVRANGS